MCMYFHVVDRCLRTTAAMAATAVSTSAAVVWRPQESRKVPMPYAGGTRMASNTGERVRT